jgi:hypothetical protein
LAAVAAVFAITTWWVDYLAVTVPIHRPPITTASYPRALPVAAVSALLVLIVDLLVLAALYRGGRRGPANSLPSGGVMVAAWRLSVGRVPPRSLAVTVIACSALLAEALLLGFPLWTVALVLLIPWMTLYLSDAAWRLDRFGAYALFGTLVVLQLGHLGEHIAQNVQLLVTHDIRQSRGVFGQLDVETVHLIWNLIAWLGCAYLLWAFGIRNRWLWVAFAVASFHTVEHLYLFWLYAVDRPLYLSGGWNGIFAQGGLFPIPLARPYLHLVYNVLEVTPFTAAFWWQLAAGAGIVHPARSVQEDRVIALG